MSYQEKYLKYKAKYIALKSKQSQSTKSKINKLLLVGKINPGILRYMWLIDRKKINPN